MSNESFIDYSFVEISRKIGLLVVSYVLSTSLDVLSEAV